MDTDPMDQTLTLRELLRKALCDTTVFPGDRPRTDAEQARDYAIITFVVEVAESMGVTSEQIADEAEDWWVDQAD